MYYTSECRGELYMIGGYTCSQAGAKPAFFFVTNLKPII